MAPVQPTGPVDLAAMAAAQGGTNEEDLSAAAGTSPSEHATDNGLQPENTGTEGDESTTPSVDPTDPAQVNLLPDDTTGVGDRVAREQSQNQQV